MPIILKSPKAKADLIEIWDYIADDSEIRADAFIQTIEPLAKSIQANGINGLKGKKENSPAIK